VEDVTRQSCSSGLEKALTWRVVCCFVSFFFFSSRRRHTRCYRDWSSDVCSSDLHVHGDSCGDGGAHRRWAANPRANREARYSLRSEERRVGKECRTWWWAYH